MNYHTSERVPDQSKAPDGYYYTRPILELPRPREQRPILHPSLSDNSSMQRRPAALHSTVQTNGRPQFPNLPGVKDILTDASTSSWLSPHASRDNQGPTGMYSLSSEGHYLGSTMHPPMALHPPHLPTGHFQGPHPRTFDVPVLNTTRLNTHASRSVPISPYAGFPDATRDYPDVPTEGVHQLPGSAYMTNGMHTSYAPVTSDDKYFHSVAPVSDHMTGSPYAMTATESQKQYLCTKETADGSFHFYEGGGRIPTHVDGEQVNPAWGLTKAMKPRKRLALACLDCREKKVRCEPGVNSCQQCEKAKRPCRKVAGQSSNSTPSSSTWQDSASSPVRKNPSTSDPTPTTERVFEPDALNKRRDRADPSPPSVSSKKHRSISPMSEIHGSSMATTADMSAQKRTSFELGASGHVSLEDDPHDVYPELTLHLLDLYFEYMDSGVYWLYPRRHLMHWAKTCKPKCQNERMVLYAILAAASIFASNTLSGFGKDCATIAGDAINTQIGKFNISVAHTKMMLALYHFAKGSMGIPWDHVGSAMRTITYLQLHTEGGCYDGASSSAQPRAEFGLSTEQLAECKRRTFWSCFVMDRLAGPTVCQIKPQDIFLRLPCSEERYEQGAPPEAPYYPNENIDPTLTLLTPSSPLSIMAWLALVAGIWGTVIDITFCAPHWPSSTYCESYQAFYTDVQNRLQGWASRLPAHWQYDEANLNESIQRGDFHAFICMHTLYHAAHMKLNQCLRHAQMPEVLTRNIREAHCHAIQQLRMSATVIRAKRTISMNGQTTECALSIPFAGYGILIAIDIVSAGGPEASLPTTLGLIESGIFCLRELSTFWNSARGQLRACERRFYQIKNIVGSGQKSRSGAWLGRRWGLELPMERDLREEDDCIYGLGDTTKGSDVYFDAFADDEPGQGGSHRSLRIA